MAKMFNADDSDALDLTSDQAAIKRCLLTQPHPSITADISKAVAIKDENVFLLTAPDGTIPLNEGHALGLYYLDCRFLRGYDLKLGGQRPIPLVSASEDSRKVVFQLTNGGPLDCDGHHIAKQELAVRWTRRIHCATVKPKAWPGLEDVLCVENLSDSDVHLPLELRFRADFEDVFVVRGLIKRSSDKPEPPHWEEDRMIYRYLGTDEQWRTLMVQFSLTPNSVSPSHVKFKLRLRARESQILRISIRINQSDNREDPFGKNGFLTLRKLDRLEDRSELRWAKRESRLTSDSLFFNRAIAQSFRDLHMLQSKIQDHEFFSAGLPWFGALFGRDSIITAMQMLAFDPDIARKTLRLLAHLQGKKINAWNDEAPGKILHEFRRGELACSGVVPYRPYYGSVDATPLFLILLEQYCQWTADLKLFSELRSNVDAALDWLDSFESENDDGYIRYSSPAFAGGIVNQGWKDAGNSIVTEIGKIAESPVALCEVQAYAWLACHSIANLFLRCGDMDRAKKLQSKADHLRAHFERDFWQDDLGTYAMALHGKNKTPIRVGSSNPGHVLWAGLTSPERAAIVSDHLMRPELFSGWGVRTLSTKEARYNPIGYHLGTVWPHENSMIFSGLRRYGFDNDARRLLMGMVEAASLFENHRLPEVFSGFSRREYPIPVRYPVACHPQAWAAGALPYMVTAMLGLVPMAFNQTLRVIRPMLPDFVDRLEIRNLRVGNGSVSLRFHQQGGRVKVEDFSHEGGLKVRVEFDQTRSVA